MMNWTVNLWSPPLLAAILVVAILLFCFHRRNNVVLFFSLLLLQFTLFGLLGWSIGMDQADRRAKLANGETERFFPIALPSPGNAEWLPEADRTLGSKADAAQSAISTPPPARITSLESAPPMQPKIAPDEFHLATALPKAKDEDLGLPGPSGGFTPVVPKGGFDVGRSSPPSAVGDPLGLLPGPVNTGAGDILPDPTSKKFVFVLDRSGSMADRDRWNRVAKEVGKILGGQKDGVEFTIIVFDNDVEWLGGGDAPVLVKKSKQSVEDAVSYMAEIKPRSGTVPLPALSKALALRPEEVFFLTDGEFTYSDTDAESLSKANSAKAKIHGTLIFEGQSPKEKNAVKQIADRHGGLTTYVSDNPKEKNP